MTAYGKGVQAEKADQALAAAGGLAEGEEIWFFAKCSNFRPMVQAIVITNVRLMGLGSDGYKYKAPITEIRASEFNDKKGTVSVTTTDGQVMVFKNIPSDDVPSLQYYLKYAQDNPAPAATNEALANLGASGSSVLVTAGASLGDFKAAAKARKAAEKQTAQQVAKADRDAKAEMAGALVASELFGLHTVEVFKNGYVRVGGMLFTSKAPYERLTTIEASSDVAKKSGAGRGAAAVMTGGLNLLGSNKRGDVYLTIVTDQETHVLHEDPPTESNLKKVKKLEAAGNATLIGRDAREAGATALPDAEESVPAGGTLTQRMRELSVMRDEGLVSPEEFDSLRSKLLESI